jgi:hypothetical protein
MKEAQNTANEPSLAPTWHTAAVSRGEQMENKGHGIRRKQLPVASKTTISVVSLLSGLVIALLSLAVERWLESPKLAFQMIDLTDQAIAGIATSAGIYFVWDKSRRAQLLDRQRFELISASTQQIRGALQLITDSAEPGTPQQGVIIYAVDHIEWVLQEVLPAVHQDPKEVRERVKEYEASQDENSGSASKTSANHISDRSAKWTSNP